MNKTDFDRFANALGTLCEVFGRELSPLAIKTYFGALGRFDLAEVEAAIGTAITTCKFFPKPFELIAFINGVDENMGDRALVEATRVLEAVKRVGGYASVKFFDPVTTATIKQGFGGWDKLCRELRADKEQWFLKDFCRLYEAYSRQGIKYLGHLAGHAEIANEDRYQEDLKPVLIGNDTDNFKLLPK